MAWGDHAVIGNCGFGVAPTRAAHRELILRTLEKVEGMSLEALKPGSGRDWPFETFPQYLDAIEARHRHQCRGADRPHAATPLRDGRGGDRTRRHRRRDRDDAHRARGDRGGCGRLRHLEGTDATSATPASRCRAARPPIEEIRRPRPRARRGGRRGVVQATVGPGFVLRPASCRHQRASRPAHHLDGAAGRHARPRRASHAAGRVAVELVQPAAAGVPQVSCRPLNFDFDLREPFPAQSARVPIRAVAAHGRQDAHLSRPGTRRRAEGYVCVAR